MVKRCCYVILLFIFAVPALICAETPDTGRTWECVSLSVKLSPEWSFTVQPGHIYEFSRSNGNIQETVFWELYAGPIYTFKISDFKIKLPLEYYYNGYPVRGKTYYLAHNIEFMPTVEYKTGDWTFSDRLRFNNRFYSSYYAADSQRKGYSMAVREMLTAEYLLIKDLSASLADEIFIGAIKDPDTTANTKGFLPTGIYQNRMYAGFTFYLTPALAVMPRYILETTYSSGNLTGVNHYAFMQVAYNL